MTETEAEVGQQAAAPPPAAAAPATAKAAISGYLPEPRPAHGVSYPLRVQYCGACSLPLELCEYSQDPGACRAWLEKNLPEEFAKLLASATTAAAAAAAAATAATAAASATGEAGAAASAASAEAGDADDKKKRQTRGGKGNKDPAKKKKDVDQRICVSRAQRGKKKSVTVITGLSTFGIDLKEASKVFGQKFATGASVTGNGDEIVIQGDVRDELFDFLPEKWPAIDEDRIEDLGDLKR